MARVALFVLLIVILSYIGEDSTTFSLKDSDQCTEIESLNTLLRKPLKKVARHWSELGTELDIQKYALENIEDNNKDVIEKFRAMMTLWYNNNTKHCWETIITALEAIDKADMAIELAMPYRMPGPVTDEGESSEWHFYKTPMPIDPEGEKIVNASKQKRGIAIIVNCDYSKTDYPLPGTNKDAEEMKETMHKLEFHTITLHNPAQSEMIAEIQKISSALPLLKDVSPDEFKAIIFVFSGHGNFSDIIFSQDFKELDLKTDIIRPLIGHRQIKRIPKIFFIDACRGSETLGQAITKGPTEQEANFRIDYATVPHHVSYMEDSGSQSVWLPTLARQLRTKNDSLQNIVATVNQEVFHRTQERGEEWAQQGETINRLNCGPLYLHPGLGEGSERSHDEL